MMIVQTSWEWDQAEASSDSPGADPEWGVAVSKYFLLLS